MVPHLGRSHDYTYDYCTINRNAKRYGRTHPEKTSTRIEPKNDLRSNAQDSDRLRHVEFSALITHVPEGDLKMSADLVTIITNTPGATDTIRPPSSFSVSLEETFRFTLFNRHLQDVWIFVVVRVLSGVLAFVIFRQIQLPCVVHVSF